MAELEYEIVDHVPSISRSAVKYGEVWDAAVQAEGSAVAVSTPKGDKAHNLANKLRADAKKRSEDFKIAVRKDTVYVQHETSGTEIDFGDEAEEESTSKKAPAKKKAARKRKATKK